jgi:hypothetical protein
MRRGTPRNAIDLATMCGMRACARDMFSRQPQQCSVRNRALTVRARASARRRVCASAMQGARVLKLEASMSEPPTT